MKVAPEARQCRATGTHRAGGFALVTCLLLLTVFAILGIAGFSAALMELRIATNVEQRERAFQAAEYGIEQALHSGDLDTAATFGTPRLVPADGTRVPLPDSTVDGYSYRLYFAESTPSGLPAHDPAAALTAFHFVIEATGYSARGAVDTHVQGFKVLRPAQWTEGPASADCAPAAADCVPLPYPDARRTSWVQLDAE